MITTIPQLRTNEELDRVLSGVVFNLDWRKNSVSVDIGGILLSVESSPKPGEIVEVTLAIENATDLFYDAGTLWRITDPAQQHYVFFRPNPREKFELTRSLSAGIWQLCLWEQ